MKSILLVLMFFCGMLGFSQSAEITIDAIVDNDTLIFFGSNNSNFVQDITIEITEAENLEGFMLPLTVRVNPNSTAIFHKLAVKGEYTYDFTYVNQFPMEKLIQPDYEVSDVKINDGIVIFDKTNCGRCQKVKAYFSENNIPFQSLNITDFPMHRKLMWDLLQLNGFTGNNIKTPVMLVNGEISHSHENLMGFVQSLH